MLTMQQSIDDYMMLSVDDAHRASDTSTCCCVDTLILTTTTTTMTTVVVVAITTKPSQAKPSQATTTLLSLLQELVLQCDSGCFSDGAHPLGLLLRRLERYQELLLDTRTIASQLELEFAFLGCK
jgi:hypothetical protein